MTAPKHLDVGAHVLDALSPTEARAFDEHLAGCESCTDEYLEFRETTALLAAAVAEPAPAGLRDKVLQAAARTPQLPPLTATGGGVDAPADTDSQQDTQPATGTHPEAIGRHRRDAAWWRRPFSLVAASVVALALIVGGIIVATAPDSSMPLQAAAQCVATAPDAQVRRPTVGSDGDATVARSCDAAVVNLGPMPSPPVGKAYQLWVMAGSNARSVGMVAQRANDSGKIVVTDLRPSDTNIGVSVEPVGGSQQPTTTPVWVVALDS